MDWFYSQMVQWHVLLAWCSVAIFFTRGLMFQFGTPAVQEIAQDARLMVLVFGVNACLVVTGLSLWGSIGYNPVTGRESMDLMYLTLRSEAGYPETPTVSEVTLIDANGDMHKALIGGFDAGIPEEFSLSQNYPNPFNPSTTISFSLPTEGQVRLAVYNLLGQEIRTLVTDNLKPGAYKAVWNSLDNSGRNVPSGMYFYRLVVDNKVISTHKMVLLK